ncbi:NAD(P)/FAD-dependent oxidoreductase [Streptomyces sp. me109]|uniref:dihydrolipoyl dehydrogenase family protein n=1 Tax=Streptomyces sp. me109 TaxID=1827853 RepID=UPI0011CD5156|nr:NAD(P)/FAD-dependent oxidoreductase [Streptomyces sp. me109]TXS61291.1 NAD(P)/FAD-dependent oxidoreductase [Streptomyces sp. me109]
MTATPADERSTYDVIVLGAGPVGQNVADRAHAAGLSVAVVERELVGGECSYWACVPSKALLRPVLAVADARRVDGAKQAVTGPIDTGGVFARRDRYVADWDDSGQARRVRSTGVDLFRGHGRLDGPRRVSVTRQDGTREILGARHAVAIATGSLQALPDIPGIAEARPWTNRHGTDSSTVPARLAIVGGGGVAVEMSTLWQGLGSQVTLLARRRLLPRMEPFVGDLVTRGLTETGVDVRDGVQVTGLRRPDAGGTVTLTLDDGSEIEADEILCATGRTPATGDIGLDTVGLTPGAWLDVDTTCLVEGVDGDWLYALGDVNHRALLTHQGKYQGRTAGDAIGARAAGEPLDDSAWGDHATTADQHAVPQVFFTDPEAGSVGLTAEQATDAGHRCTTIDLDMTAAQGANLYADGYRGHARIVVDLDREVLLGATFVGQGVSELLHSATVAVVGEVPLKRLRHAVACFPTISEIWLFLLAAYQQRKDN